MNPLIGFPSIRSTPRAVCLLLFFILAGCGESEDRPAWEGRSYRKSDEEWFWRDRLSRRPEPLAATVADLDQEATLVEALESLRGKPPATTLTGVEALAAAGEPLLPLLDRYLADEDRTLRWASVQAISRIGGARSVEPLCRALFDPWDATAVLAATTLARAKIPWTVPRLLKTLGPYPVDFNPHLMVRVKAAAALIELKNFSGVPFLIKILKEGTPAQDPLREWKETTRMAWEQEEALQALAKLTGTDHGYHVDGSAASQAQAALAFEAWWLENRLRLWEKNRVIHDSLLALKVRELVEGLDSFQARNADGARFCLKYMGPPVFPFLAEALSKGAFYERFHALEIIAALAPLAGGAADDWANTVAGALKDDAPAVRMKAAQALGFLGRAGSVPCLREALLDMDLDVQLGAVAALGRIGGPEARRLLEKERARASDAQMELEIMAAQARLAVDFRPAFLAELLTESLARQEIVMQKIIDLTGDAHGYEPGLSPEKRREAQVNLQQYWKKK